MLSFQKASSSKLLLKSKSKLKKQKVRNLRIPLLFFINPINCNRIYRDYLIPDYTNISGSPIYLFQEYLHYKSITQVHHRDKGLCFQFLDNDPEFITPLGLLQSRLNSLGNKSAHEMAEYLPIYYSYFQSIEETSTKNSLSFSQKPIKSTQRTSEPLMPSANSQLLTIIDGLLLENEGNVALIGVTEYYKGLDDRFIIVGFNKECLGLMLFDEEDLENIFENEFIENCLKIFSCSNYENCMKELIEILGNVSLRKENNTEKCVYAKEMNTIFGLIKAEFCLKIINVEIDGVKFVIFLSVMNEEENPWLRGLIKNKKSFLIGNGGVEIEIKKIKKISSDWENLMKYYYPKILKGPSPSLKKTRENSKKNQEKSNEN